MNHKIIIANWKQNPETLDEGIKLINISEEFQKESSNKFWSDYENNISTAGKYNIYIAHAVPSIFAEKLFTTSKKTGVILQNVSEFEGGSHTGDISVKQMKDCGIHNSIVGHSETRLTPANPRGDENAQVNSKIKILVENNSGFLLCVGEYERFDNDSQAGKDARHFEFVKKQLEECLQDISSETIADNIIAYEPIWAIGKSAKRVATNEEIIEMIDFIKNFIKEKFAVETHVVYGGSVDENNAKEILNLKGVDGLLIGRASSNADTWEKLLNNVGNYGPIQEAISNNTFKYKQITDLEIPKNSFVLLRLDLNVPINEHGEIVNDFRIVESLSTIKLLQDMGAKVIIIAHREKGDFKVIAEYLKSKIDNFYYLTRDLQEGEVLLLDNLRLNEGEKKNDENFAKSLIEMTSGNVYYVNEAFSASHREHASIVGIPKILGKERCALGPKFIEEITKLSLALKPKHPMLLIVGGAKFDTKLSMLEKFTNIADHIFVGGALSHNFWKQKFNYNLGKSLLDEEVKLSTEVLSSNKILLPEDVMVESREVKKPNEIGVNERIVDFGPKSLQQIFNLAEDANTIVWNGPLGYYEGGYESGTKKLLLGLNEIQKRHADKVVILGGGDTVTEIDKTNSELIAENKEIMKFTHISTGGGAMIDFLSNGTLPGIDAVTS